MTLLNEADAIYIGDTAADRVYLGANLVWEPASTGPWTPHEIETAMWGWWDASIPSSLTWSGLNLLEIGDQGPNNIHMGRFTISGPTATTLNGLGALAFTYDQGLMTSVPTTFNDFTIHAVWNPGFSDGNTYERIVDHAYATGWWFGRTGGTQTFGGGVMEGPEVGYGIFVPLANNEVHQISNVREGGMHRISGNGGAVTNSRAIHTNPTASDRVYMAQDNLGTSDVTDGEIGEVIIWKRALPLDEMQKTEGYLAWKWGIQAKLPAGHPYKDYAPGTTPPPAGPPVTAGLNVWLDASQLALADGAAVSPWPDLSGGGRDGIVTASGPPVLRANALNGKPVVRFTVNEGRIRGDTGLGGGTAGYNYSILYVCRMVGPNVGRIFAGTYPITNFLVGYHTSSQDVAFDGQFMGAVVGYPSGTPRPWKQFAYTASHDGATYLIDFYIDGGLIGTTTGMTNGLQSRYNLSGYDATGSQETCDCEVAELLIYNRKLTDPERVSVEDYLRAKWGLPEPTLLRPGQLPYWPPPEMVMPDD